MIRNFARGSAALLAALLVAACHKPADDATQTGSQAGMTAGDSATARGGAHARRGGAGGSYQPGEKVAAKSGGLFSRHERALPTGTAVTAVSQLTVTSRSSHVGDRVTARVEMAVVSATGDTVIPYGADLVGHVTAIATAPHPGQWGTLHLAFDTLEVSGQAMPVEVKVDSMRAEMRGRGVTTTDAAKVGAGAVIGGIAGRIIGGNRTGTIVGAAAGGAAGGVVAHNTRTEDIVLPAGAAIHLELTQPFDRAKAVASSR